MGRYHPSRIQSARREERSFGARGSGRARGSGGRGRGGAHHSSGSVTDEKGEVLLHHSTYAPGTKIYDDFKDEQHTQARGRSGRGGGGPPQRRTPPSSGPAEVSASAEKRVHTSSGDGGRKRSMSQMLLEEFDREPNSWGGMKGGSGSTSSTHQPTMAERRRREEFEIYEQQRLREEQQRAGEVADGDLVPVARADTAAPEGILDHRNIGTRDIPVVDVKGGASSALLSPATKVVAERAVTAFSVATVILQTAYCCVEASLTFKMNDAPPSSTNLHIPIFSETHEADAFIIETTAATDKSKSIRRVALSVPFIVEALDQEQMGVGGDRLVEELLTTKYLGNPTSSGDVVWYMMRALSRGGSGAHLAHSSPHTHWIEVGPQLVDLLKDIAIRRNRPGGPPPSPPSPSSKALENILFGQGGNSTAISSPCGVVGAFMELAHSLLKDSLSPSGPYPIGTAPHVSALYGAFCFMAKMHAYCSTPQVRKRPSLADDVEMAECVAEKACSRGTTRLSNSSPRASAILSTAVIIKVVIVPLLLVSLSREVSLCSIPWAWL
jgi:hypothetical protein